MKVKVTLLMTMIWAARARRRLQHPRGREDYRIRARTVEPVFGQLKTCQKMTMMSRRGLTACRMNISNSLL